MVVPGARILKPVDHDEELTIVEHLDELRSRLIVCLVVLVAAFAVCLWQSRPLLGVLNAPLERAADKAERAPTSLSGRERELRKALRDALAAQTRALEQLAEGRALSQRERRALAAAVAATRSSVRQLARSSDDTRPVTLSLGEPFTQTVLVAFQFALLFALPVILHQAWAFVAPAFAPHERRTARALVVGAPALFAAGVAFAYFVVLPTAVAFLQQFNAGAFDALVQARSYYHFVLITALATGLLFQLPLAMVGLVQLGVVSSDQLRRNRRIAIVVLAVVAALLPGTDPITTLIELVPMVLLFELGLLLARIVERRRARTSALADAGAGGAA